MHSHIPPQLPFHLLSYVPTTSSRTASEQRAAETRRALLRAAAEAKAEDEDDGSLTSGWTVGRRSGSQARRQPQFEHNPDAPDDGFQQILSLLA